MKIYIDCEFNDYLGPLISMALVANDGREWYEVIECKNPSQWVADNVIPVLHKKPVSKEQMQASLKEFLNSFETIHIIADWHEDIQHFCSLLTRGPGKVIGHPDKMVMEVKKIISRSLLPHNALEDARAIRNADDT